MNDIQLPCESCVWMKGEKRCGTTWWFVEIYQEFLHRELPDEMEIALKCKKKMEEREP